MGSEIVGNVARNTLTAPPYIGKKSTNRRLSFGQTETETTLIELEHYDVILFSKAIDFLIYFVGILNTNLFFHMTIAGAPQPSLTIKLT